MYQKKTETVSSKTTVPDSMLCISYKIMFQIINFQVVDASWSFYIIIYDFSLRELTQPGTWKVTTFAQIFGALE